MYLIELEKIQEILSWEFIKSQKKLKNQLSEQDYLFILDLQLKSNFFLYDLVYEDLTKSYDYLYYKIFNNFINKYKGQIYDESVFYNDIPLYSDMYTKYTLKALLKNEWGKFFFTYLNRWINKFLSEVYKKMKVMPTNWISLDSDLVADNIDHHKKTSADLTIRRIIDFIEEKVDVTENLTLFKYFKNIKEAIEGEEEIKQKDITKLLENLPKEVYNEIRDMLIS